MKINWKQVWQKFANKIDPVNEASFVDQWDDEVIRGTRCKGQKSCLRESLIEVGVNVDSRKWANMNKRFKRWYEIESRAQFFGNVSWAAQQKWLRTNIEKDFT